MDSNLIFEVQAVLQGSYNEHHGTFDRVTHSERQRVALVFNGLQRDCVGSEWQYQ